MGSGLCFSNWLVSDVDNWKSKLYKLKQSLGLWSQSNLSFIGHSMILCKILEPSCPYLLRVFNFSLRKGFL